MKEVNHEVFEDFMLDVNNLSEAQLEKLLKELVFLSYERAETGDSKKWGFIGEKFYFCFVKLLESKKGNDENEK